MAVFVLGAVVCLLLFVVTLQLRGIRRQLGALRPPQQVGVKDQEMALEAWVAELEARGQEILSRLEQERSAVAALVREVRHTLATAGTAGAGAAYSAEAGPAAVTYRRPVAASAAEQQLQSLAAGAETTETRDWVRHQLQPAAANVDSGWTTARRRIGQDWQEVERKVQEMAARGVAPPIIARTLGLGQGEVELLIHKAVVQ